MSGTRRITQRKAARTYGFKALDGAPEGTFEAIVSVFGNVDYSGERVMPGFFAKSLDQWRASGDPIPVIFSHQWDNLDAHVGVVLEARELLAGDPMLPPDLIGNGGLYIKGQLDIAEPFAGRLWQKMTARAIREFSFAYDVTKARPGAGGALDLLEGDLIEVGPTLKGMNPATELIGAKANGPLQALDAADEFLSTITPAVGDDQAPGTAAKSLPAELFPGSVEESLGAVAAAAEVWAGLEYGHDLYAVHLEATYPDQGRVIVTAERWEDPWGGGPVWQLNYTVDDAGLVTIETATALEMEVSFRPKRQAAAGRMFAKLGTSTGAAMPSGIVPDTSNGKADEPAGAKADDPETRTGGPSPAQVMLEADILAL